MRQSKEQFIVYIKKKKKKEHFIGKKLVNHFYSKCHHLTFLHCVFHVGLTKIF